MGVRALRFSEAHPYTGVGYLAAIARLDDRLARAEEAKQAQLSGTRQVRAATSRKRYLRRMLRRGHLAHVIRVARFVDREISGLREKFVLPRGTIPFETFLTAARGMAAEAQQQRDVFIRHGMSEIVLDGLLQSLDEFEAAVHDAGEGCRRHVGASAELDKLANEVVEIVGILDALNQIRFEHDAQLIAAWRSASNVVATPRSAPASEPNGGSDIRPAA